jgi:hypothetical protein
MWHTRGMCSSLVRLAASFLVPAGLVLATLVVACGDPGAPAPAGSGPPLAVPDAAPGGGADAPRAGAAAPQDASPEAPSAPVVLTATAGTRLRPTFIRPADDELGAFAGWRDTQLGFDCTFTLMADGKHRCTPRESSLYTGAEAFSDAACTKRVLLSVRRPCPEPYVLLGTSPPGACQATFQPYRRGTKVDVQTIYRKVDGVCTPVAVPAQREIWELGAAVEASTLVAAELKPQGTGPLVLTVLEAEDGARQPTGRRDPRGAGFACTYLKLRDGTTRCVPSLVGRADGLYADSACTQRGARISERTCQPERRYIWAPVPQTCPTAFGLHAEGAVVATPWIRTASACSASAVVSSSQFVALGDEAPPGEFVEVTVDRIARGKRLELRTRRAGETTLADGTFWDTVRGSWCSAERASDGVLRCLPFGEDVAPEPSYWLDAACTGQALGVIESAAVCAPKLIRRLDDSACPPRVRLFAAAAHAGALYRRNDQGACEGVRPNPGFVAFAAGAEVPATDFAELRGPE